MNRYCKLEKHLAFSHYQLSSCVRRILEDEIPIGETGNSRSNVKKKQRERGGSRRKRKRKKRRRRARRTREKRSSTGLRGNYKIAKINHKIRPAYRRYHKASRTTGRSAHIFGVYDQSPRRTSSGICVSLPSREYGPRGWILPAERKLHGDFAPPFEMPL